MEKVNLKKLDLPTLVDMLAKQTAEYMRILKDGGTKHEYELCKTMIDKLTREINLRKNPV